jgi:ribose transport system ATP-binding protein
VGQGLNCGHADAERPEADMTGPEPLLSLERITKSFDATQALRGVSLTIGAGEFVGLVGPNGAGKSTLIKILDGLYAPDSGTIRINGEARAGGRGRVSGIGVVHQDLALVDSLTVSENLRLGQPPLYSVPPLLSTVAERAFCADALAAVGLPEELASATLERLSLGERTLVAIARTLAQGASLVVVDEATSALSPRESQWLINTLKARKLAGAAILMVSHKLAEILESVDRCVVLVDGMVKADAEIGQLDLAKLIVLMAPTRGRPGHGRPSASGAGPAGGAGQPEAPVLELRDARGDGAGPFTLQVRPGQIVGVTGLAGSGLNELAMLASGRLRPVAGSVTVPGGGSVGLLPPDRSRQASFPAESVAWNLTFGALGRWRRRGGLLNLTAEQAEARKVIADLDIRPGDPAARLTSLSGGNQQKVLLGRMLLSSASCLVLCEPTRGVDVQARAEIYQLIRSVAARGVGVLIVSSDSEDLLALADTVGVVEQRSCTHTRRVDQLTTQQMASLL